MTTDNDRLRALAAAAELPAAAAEAPRVTRATLVFRVGNRQFGADARHIYEVIVSGPLTQVPMAKSYVLGITLVRGRVVPVISLGELLGFDVGDESAPTLPRLLIVRDGPLEIALLSHATLGLFEIDAADLGAAGATRRDCVIGEFDFRGSLVLRLDIPALLRTVTGEAAAS